MGCEGAKAAVKEGVPDEGKEEGKEREGKEAHLRRPKVTDRQAAAGPDVKRVKRAPAA